MRLTIDFDFLYCSVVSRQPISAALREKGERHFSRLFFIADTLESLGQIGFPLCYMSCLEL